MSETARPGAPSSVAEAVGAEGGRVTFARFMEIALTHPTVGYYGRVDRLLGRRGDFSTAPTLSPFFNRTVARLVTELVGASLAAPDVAAAPAADGAGSAGAAPGAVARVPAETPTGRPCVVEFGGGEGHLAESILRFWESEHPDLRGRIDYRIVEVGERLRQRQAAAVARFAVAGWDVGWGDDLEEACLGSWPAVIIGNEFLDALPVHLVDVGGTMIREAHVTADDADLVGAWGDLSDAAADEIGLLFGTLDPRRLGVFTEDGILEVCPHLNDLMRRVAGAMPSGSFVSIDYGEWFPGLAQAGHPWGLEGHRRRRRSVRGYFKHQLVTNPLTRAGRQDLTADVDFAALDLHGRQEGFETVLFTTLARFLRGGGAEDELEALHNGTAQTAGDTLEADRQATALASLLDEQDLGGAFKVMALTRESPGPGFSPTPIPLTGRRSPNTVEPAC